jgi:hypothetical protein
VSSTGRKLTFNTVIASVRQFAGGNCRAKQSSEANARLDCFVAKANL